jgi:hypothetical protein
MYNNDGGLFGNGQDGEDGVGCVSSGQVGRVVRQPSVALYKVNSERHSIPFGLQRLCTHFLVYT